MVQVTNQTDALVEETLTLEGTHGALLREYLRHQPATSRRPYVAGVLKAAGAELLELSLANLEESQSSLILTLVYSLRSQFHEAGGELVGKPSACFEHSYLTTDSAEKRLTPFQVTTPLTLQASVAVRAPEGFRAKASQSPGRKWDQRFVRGQLDAFTEKSGWRLNYKLHEPAGRFAAGDYADFCATLNRASSDLSPEVTFERVSP